MITFPMGPPSLLCAIHLCSSHHSSSLISAGGASHLGPQQQCPTGLVQGTRQNCSRKMALAFLSGSLMKLRWSRSWERTAYNRRNYRKCRS